MIDQRTAPVIQVIRRRIWFLEERRERDRQEIFTLELELADLGVELPREQTTSEG